MTSALLCHGPTTRLVARCIAGGRSNALWPCRAVCTAQPATRAVWAPAARRGLKPRLHRMAGTSASAAGSTEGAADDGPVVQYIVLRKDLRDGLSWPLVRVPRARNSWRAWPCVGRFPDHNGVTCAGQCGRPGLPRVRSRRLAEP